jgi:hypothetical protein
LAKVRWWLLALGVFVAVQSLIPWTPDRWRLFAILIGIALIIASFPGYEFLLRQRWFWADMDSIDDDEDDRELPRKGQ